MKRTRGLCLCLSLLWPVVSDGGPARLTPADIFDLELVSDPQISPDGKRIVYVRRYADITSDRRLSNLWIIDFDGSNHRPLTTGAVSDASPRWAPDGRQLVFVSQREGPAQLYAIRPETGQIVRLTNLQHAPQAPVWSPDGKQIAFASFVPEPATAYASAPAPPAGARWQPQGRVIDTLVYRRENAGYLKPGHTQVFVLPAEGGTPRQISRGPFDHDGEIVWTPDGAHLLISANRRPNAESEPRGSEIYEFSISDDAVRALTDRSGPDVAPAISPDGKQLAYVGFDDQGGFDYQVTRLYVMNRDGSNRRVLSQGLDRDVESPRWAPDGSGVFFAYEDQGTTKLGFLSVDGRLKEIARSLGGGSGVGVAYGGTGYFGRAAFSIGGNGNFAFTYSRPDVPCDLAVGTTGQAGTRVITRVNEDLLRNRPLGEVEEIWYSSGLDGRKIQGWIIKPPDFDASKKYPLVLEIHGGPWLSYGDRFDIEKQLMAAAGYVVFYPNYRGSTGYGFDFAHLIEKVHPGIVGDERNPGDVVADMLSGIDAVAAKGYVDRDNLFVTGLSAGGTLTFWMIGRSDRFRAAVAHAPSGANWASFVLYADRPALVKYRFPGPPWQHLEHYTKRSPISLIENVKTPTLIVTGDEDTLTPMPNSEEYYFALKWLNVETVLVQMPGEPHGSWRYPSHHAAKMAYTVAWFDRHKKPESTPSR